MPCQHRVQSVSEDAHPCWISAFTSSKKAPNASWNGAFWSQWKDHSDQPPLLPPQNSSKNQFYLCLQKQHRLSCLLGRAYIRELSWIIVQWLDSQEWANLSLPTSITECLPDGHMTTESPQMGLFVALFLQLQPRDAVPVPCSVSGHHRVHLLDFHVIWTRTALVVSAARGQDCLPSAFDWILVLSRFLWFLHLPCIWAWSGRTGDRCWHSPGDFLELNTVPLCSLYPKCPFLHFLNYIYYSFFKHQIKWEH